MVRRLAFGAPAVSVCLALAACGTGLQSQPELAPTTANSPVVTSAPAPPVQNPLDALIAASQKHFTNGQQELSLGHLTGAKREFDEAIEILLASPYGARTEPKLRDHFDRLVDRISAYEISALAEGDGFTEQSYEPASIDALLAESTFAPAPTPELQEAVKTDLEASAHDVPIPLNTRVLSYITLFQGRLHDYLQEGLVRGGQYLPMIQNVFRAEGLPLDLAYVPLIESAFKPNALSRAKAKGVWQFMRGTGIENGLLHDWYVDERSDPEKATQAAAKYLKTLSTTFDGDWHLALASYNGGPYRVQRAIKRTGASDFWALSAKSRTLPRETREYVPMILAAMVIARNPAQYGFEPAVATPIQYETVILPRAVDLRRVAEWTGSSIDTIQALNPELRRWTTPVRDPDYELKVPPGTADALRVRITEAETADMTSLQWYTVKRGETLLAIANKLRVNRTDLAEANYLSTRARVLTGQRLIIPRAPTALMAARMDRPVPEIGPIVAQNTTAAAPSMDGQRSKLVYRVKRGDTLSSIARLFNTSVASLRSWNSLRGTMIKSGDRLTIFTRR